MTLCVRQEQSYPPAFYRQQDARYVRQEAKLPLGLLQATEVLVGDALLSLTIHFLRCETMVPWESQNNQIIIATSIYNT